MRETMTDKRRQILDAALALCAEDGLQGAATARIAKAAGVANGTLFHHFPSKKVLIQCLYFYVHKNYSSLSRFFRQY